MAQIYCCGCGKTVRARLTDGIEIYPHRPDLKKLPFWRCDECRNFVGCHHKTGNPTQPLGCIATPEIKEARKHIHRILDPLWKSGKYKRNEIYAIISERMGMKGKYHTAKIRSVEEARKVYTTIKNITKEQGK